MANNPIIRSKHHGPQPVTPASEVDQISHEEKQRRQLVQSVHISAVALALLAMVAVLFVCYVAKLVLVTLMVSILLAFMLAPVVTLCERIRMPRPAGAFLAVVLLLAVAYGGTHFFYNRALSFIQELPKYSQKIRGVLSHVIQQADQLQQTTEKVLPPDKTASKAIPVVMHDSGSRGMIASSLSAVTEVVLTLAFIPFLVYFMLSWQEHARTKTVQLFSPEYRSTAYVTLGQISLMMRSFITGNFVIGLIISVVSIIAFAFLKIPYFYFLGLISGFLSLVPYLGVVLALLPPVAAGLGTLGSAGMITVVATVLGLHLIAMNILYPKVIGRRLQLNPLVVGVALLIWGWIWGAMGLVLAIPITGAIKIICDHSRPLRPIGAWMGE